MGDFRMNEKKKMICTKCFEVIEPNDKNSVPFGYEDEGILSISHAPPCGDGMNETDAMLIEYSKDNLESIAAFGKETIMGLNDVTKSLGDDLNLCMELLIGERNVIKFRNFLRKKRREKSNTKNKFKKYDYKKAIKIIIERKPKVASLGIIESWEKTSEKVYEDGKFLLDLEKESEIMGITGSYRGTPTLDIDGETIECWII